MTFSKLVAKSGRTFLTCDDCRRICRGTGTA